MSKVTTLILSDIHNHWQRAEQIIRHECPDNIVFLGDYFDNFGDDSRIAAETADWLRGSIVKKNRTHIMGNHDVNYAFKHVSYKCSGYETRKDCAINRILKESDWRKLPLYTWVGNWLCSHAGVHPIYYNKLSNGKPINEWLIECCDEALNVAFQDKPAVPIMRAGFNRGGSEVVGGITWCDYDEFVPIDGVNQIFGHTPHRMPVWKNNNKSKNLDLDVCYCSYYALHNSVTDELVVKYYGDI